jgi:hypothetical protein
MSNLLLTWEQFLYELSNLGFHYSKASNAWEREDGAVASDEALRDLHSHWPVFLSAALKLWSEGKKTVSVEVAWEDDAFVARLRAVE